MYKTSPSATVTPQRPKRTQGFLTVLCKLRPTVKNTVKLPTRLLEALLSRGKAKPSGAFPFGKENSRRAASVSRRPLSSNGKVTYIPMPMHRLRRQAGLIPDPQTWARPPAVTDEPLQIFKYEASSCRPVVTKADWPVVQPPQFEARTPSEDESPLLSYSPRYH